MTAIASQKAPFMSYLATPVGYCTISADSDKITSLGIATEEPDFTIIENQLTEDCSAQLQAYFKGDLRIFDLPLNTQEYSPFYQSVWAQLIAIPYGKTASYSDIAFALDNPKAVRAVGLANGKNPFTIVIPCHRIIGKNNSMTGYAHGVSKKRWLLEHEGAIQKELTLFS